MANRRTTPLLQRNPQEKNIFSLEKEVFLFSAESASQRKCCWATLDNVTHDCCQWRLCWRCLEVPRTKLRSPKLTRKLKTRSGWISTDMLPDPPPAPRINIPWFRVHICWGQLPEVTALASHTHTHTQQKYTLSLPPSVLQGDHWVITDHRCSGKKSAWTPQGCFSFSLSYA